MRMTANWVTYYCEKMLISNDPIIKWPLLLYFFYSEDASIYDIFYITPNLHKLHTKRKTFGNVLSSM